MPHLLRSESRARLGRTELAGTEPTRLRWSPSGARRWHEERSKVVSLVSVRLVVNNIYIFVVIYSTYL